MRLKSIGSMRNLILASTRSLHPGICNHFQIGIRRYGIDSLADKGGLFGLGTVRSPKDFRALTDHVYEKGRSLLTEALGGRQRRRKLVVVLDELSDAICQAADMAECVRMIHPRSSFADEAEQCVSQLGQFVESLNSNRELYVALRRSAESDDADSSCREPLDEVDRRVMTLLIDDMESSGIHLPDAQRYQFIEYNSGIFAIGSEFVRAAHEFKTVRTKIMNTDDFLRRQKDRLKTLLTLRHRLACLVGYQSYAERAVRGSFLETPSQVHQFLKTLVDELKGKKALDDVISQSLPFDAVEVEKRRIEVVANGKKDVDSLCITLNQLVGDKINAIAERLVGLRFERQEPEKHEVWHPSVTKLVAYNVKDSKQPLGVVYCDWYDRERKCGEAHFTIRCGRELQLSLRQHGEIAKGYQTPIVVLSFRIPPPKQGTTGEAECDYWTSPLVLSGTQTETILHEFGHALHTLVGRTRYQHVSGTRCSTDLAEIPSTFLEHFVLDEKTAQPLWGSAFDHHRAKTRTNGIVEILDQSVLALTDLRLHTVDPEQAFVEEVSASITKELELPLVSEDKLLIFEHLVPYGAKYHSYIVAKALAALLWRRGGFSGKPLERQPGETYRRLLSFGGEKYPRELMELTIGDVPSAQALAKSLAEDVAGNLEQQRVAREKQNLE